MREGCAGVAPAERQSCKMAYISGQVQSAIALLLLIWTAASRVLSGIPRKIQFRSALRELSVAIV